MKHLTIFFFLLSQIFVNAQNLVSNGGFEQHVPLSCLVCENLKFNLNVPNWNCSNSVPNLCDCNYRKNIDEEKLNICSDKYQPHSGCAMLQMDYHPRCVDYYFRDIWGCASYVSTKLDTPLKMGKVYEVGFYLFVPSPLINWDSLQPQNIGVTLTPSAIPEFYGAMIPADSLLIDTVVYDKWYYVNWFIQPTCDIKRLVIGTFRNANFPKNHVPRMLESIYFIDDVVVREVSGVLGDTVTAFCKETETEGYVEEIENVIVYFENNQAIIQHEYKVLLDSIAKQIKRNHNRLFFVSGHTDAKGDNHDVLSKKRVDAVIAYFKEVHKIQDYRFLPLAEGDKKPIASNATEEGRKKNRRVEVQASVIETSQMIYRKILIYTNEGKLDSAIYFAKIWLHLSEEGYKILMTSDPRLGLLFKNPAVLKNMETEVKKHYKDKKQTDFAYQLDKLWTQDQKERTLDKYIEELGYVPYLEDFKLPERDTAGFNDAANLVQLNVLLNKYGYPKESEVGKRAAKTAALVLIHSEDTAALKKYLPLFEQNCREGEGDWGYYAMMYDKWCVKRQQPQRYGTQYLKNPKNPSEIVLFPLENPAQINERRKIIGLQPLGVETINKALGQ